MPWQTWVGLECFSFLKASNIISTGHSTVWFPPRMSLTSDTLMNWVFFSPAAASSSAIFACKAATRSFEICSWLRNFDLSSDSSFRRASIVSLSADCSFSNRYSRACFSRAKDDFSSLICSVRASSYVFPCFEAGSRAAWSCYLYSLACFFACFF